MFLIWENDQMPKATVIIEHFEHWDWRFWRSGRIQNVTNPPKPTLGV